MINSIKQMSRAPLKLIALFFMIIISAVLLVVGSTMLINSNKQLNDIEKSCITLATVQQNEDAIEVSSTFDGASKTYRNYKYPIYDSIIPTDILKFDSANYLLEPEKRPFYGAYMEEYNTSRNSTFSDDYTVIEFTPVTNCVPDHPVDVEVTNVLSGELEVGSIISFCDHYNDNPQSLQVQKTYIATVLMKDNNHDDSGGIEWAAYDFAPFTTQHDKNGNLVASDISTVTASIEEVNETFINSNRKEKWQNMCTSFKMLDKTIPVLPTNNLDLLPTFHLKQSSIVDGRKISKKEFDNGEKVCIVSKDFATANNLKIGDEIEMPLYFANYNESPGILFGHDSRLNFSLLNANGDIYPVFSNHKYKIVGIYYTTKVTSINDTTEMGYDQIIIPSKSVKESDKNNIADYGVMSNETTSFIIPNGTIEEYQNNFSKLDKSSLLKITFDDMGYTQMKHNLENAKESAYILCAAGIIVTMIIILMVLYFYVIKQKRQIAILRALGTSKRQCYLFILSGLVLWVIMGSIIGSAIGFGLTTTNDSYQNNSYFSYEYSLLNYDENNENEIIKPGDDLQPSLVKISILTPVILTGSILFVCLIATNKYLKEDVMQLLLENEVK